MSDRDQKVADRMHKLQDMISFGSTCGFRTVSYGEGKARVELTVTEAVQNVNGALHGGCTAALVDHVGTLAIVTADRDARPGVTTDLNVTYMAPAPLGEVVHADATVLKIGKVMAYVTVDVRRADGALVAQGRMSKFQGG